MDLNFILFLDLTKPYFSTLEALALSDNKNMWVKIKIYFWSLIKFIVVILSLLAFGVTAFGVPASSTLQGQIIKPNGLPLESPGVLFTVQILSQVNSCLLHEETFTLDMSNTKGVFSFSLGSGFNTGNGGLASYSQALNNSIGNITGLTCVTGTDYSPSPTDNRKLRVTFDDGTGVVLISDNNNIESVPYAQYAAKLGGLSAPDFIQVNSSTAGVTQANLETIFDNGSNQSELTNLILGTSDLYSRVSSSGAGSLPRFTTGSPPTSPNTGDIWFNTDDNKVYYHNGTTSQAISSDAGTVTQIVVGSGLSGGTITSTGTIAIASGGVTNSHLATGLSASKITTGTLPAGVVPSGTDSTKLPLAGGTMAGNININGFQLLGTGHVTQNPQSTITLGAYTTSEETNLVSTLTPSHAGATWYNSNTNKVKFWDGTEAKIINTSTANISSVTASAPLSSSGGTTPNINLNLGEGLFNNGGQLDINLATDPGLEFNANQLRTKVGAGLKLTASGIEVDIGTAAGQLVSNDDFPNCNSNQKLQMSAGPTYTLSCIADVDITLAGSTAGGDLTGTYPNPTIANDAVTTNKILDGNVTGSKLENSGVTTGTYTKITVDAKGRATNGTNLTASDIPNLDAAKITTGTLSTARLNVGTGANQLVQMDGSARLPALDGSLLTNLPGGDGDFMADGSVPMTGNLELGSNYLSGDGDSEGIYINNTGQVGVGTLAPASTLDIRGSARSVSSSGTSYTNSVTSVNWARGNAQEMTVPCNNTSFTEMLDGGVYTLAVVDTTSSICVFSQAGLTFYYNPVNQSRISGTRTVYTFQRIGNAVYVAWVSGYQP